MPKSDKPCRRGERPWSVHEWEEIAVPTGREPVRMCSHCAGTQIKVDGVWGKARNHGVTGRFVPYRA